jgi:hypothetical protein
MARNATSPGQLSAFVAKPTAGSRLIADLSKDDDPYALTFLIEQAGEIADNLERLSGLLNGERSSWCSLKLGTETIEVVVNDPLREQRQQATVLRHLLAEVHRQRARIPMGDDDDDVLADLGP